MQLVIVAVVIDIEQAQVAAHKLFDDALLSASLSFLSQYPGEEEILFPPMSYLEVTGATRLETEPSGLSIRVVSLSVNANQTCGTIEEILASRQHLHVAMLENYKLEIEGVLEEMLQSEVGCPDHLRQMCFLVELYPGREGANAAREHEIERDGFSVKLTT